MQSSCLGQRCDVKAKHYAMFTIFIQKIMNHFTALVHASIPQTLYERILQKERFRPIIEMKGLNEVI